MLHYLNKRNNIVQHVLFGAGILLVLIFSLWKCKYGLGNSDEPFYLTIPYRMCQGDKLFLDEWHVSQTSAFLLAPLMKIYLMLCKNTDGIILNFRYIYILINMIVAVVGYCRLKNYGKSAGVICILYFLFVPFNIMALSYNTIGLAANFLCTIFLFTARDRCKSDYIVAGIFYAAMVLCQPLLIIIFCIEFIAMIIYSMMTKKYIIIHKGCWFLIGCIMMAIPIVIYLLFVTGVSNVLNTIPEILKDPEHKAVKSFKLLLFYCTQLYFPETPVAFGELIFNTKSVLIISYIFFIIIWGISLFDKEGKFKSICMVISAMLAAIASCCFLPFVQNSFINFIVFPWALHGVTMFLFVKDKQIRKILGIAGMLGISHATTFLASNNYGYVFNIALLPMGLIAMMLSIYEWEKLDKKIKIGKAIIVLCIFITILNLAYARLVHVFWQTSPNTLKTQCKYGPVKGIYVS